MTALLTIDADWVMNPTPQQQIPGWRSGPYHTLEALVYDYGAERGNRADSARHRFSQSASDFASTLWSAGLSGDVPVIRTDEHGDIKDVWTEAQLEQVRRIVICDAHLDVYPILTVRLDSDLTGERLQHVTVYEILEGMLDHLENLGGVVWEDAVWHQAWLLMVLLRTPQLESVDWVVPLHFGPALETGFPYEEAQWMETLRVGQARGVWSYSLNKGLRRITMHVCIPGKSRRRRLRVNVLTLDELGHLERVVAPIHLCDSPTYTTEESSDWTDTLESLLSGGRKGAKKRKKEVQSDDE
jgi:hypothetical protein